MCASRGLCTHSVCELILLFNWHTSHPQLSPAHTYQDKAHQTFSPVSSSRYIQEIHVVVSLLMPTECQCRRQCHDCPMSSPLVTCSTPDCQAFAELVGDDQWSTMLARKLACNLRHANSVSIIYSRHISTTARRLQQATRLGLPADLQYFPDFFSIREQRALLDVALRKLDISERRSFRLRRKELMRTRPTSGTTDDRVSVQSLFLPDEYYDFQEVCRG